MTEKKNRVFFLSWLQLLFFLVLVARLIELQLIEGEKNRILADENRVRRNILPAGRGIIFDRQGLPLVENIPLYRYQEGSQETSFKSIDRQTALKIESQGESEANKIKVGVGRKYLYGEILSHLLGYIGQVSEEEISSAHNVRQAGDLVGRGGIEQQYDALLRGKAGAEISETDAIGEKVRTIGRIEPQAGQDLHLSVDLRLAQIAHEALGEQAGAIIASEVKTGQILCLESLPSFDPNKLSLGISTEEYQQILEDPRKPFFNRAIGGAYPPGSTFKIVTAAAGLEEDKITGSTLIDDPGVINVGPFSYRNWYFTQYGRTEGEINIVRALKRSTDTFFYQLGERLGADRLSAWAKNFGLGQLTRIDLPGEVTGLVPNPDWKEKVRGEPWFLGNTYHFAIGQADLTVTPLQINMMTSVIAANGLLCQPGIIKQSDFKQDNCRDLKLKKATLQLIKEGMKEACSSGGTAFPLFDFRPQVACKTGTAEFGDPKDRTHAWLTVFAPADDPEIVMTVLVEAGGEGSSVAAPIAKKILEAWFKKG
ncbi:MAG TPA: penicillin-binding protein 2 [Candidatus Bathyarchaeia archaeon]|nr:penicillin-binding protein 2 [Candidatus Bathyarchaeia archaeon]